MKQLPLSLVFSNILPRDSSKLSASSLESSRVTRSSSGIGMSIPSFISAISYIYGYFSFGFMLYIYILLLYVIIPIYVRGSPFARPPFIATASRIAAAAIDTMPDSTACFDTSMRKKNVGGIGARVTYCCPAMISYDPKLSSTRC